MRISLPFSFLCFAVLSPISGARGAVLAIWDFSTLANPADGGSNVSTAYGETLAAAAMHASGDGGGYSIGDLTGNGNGVYTGHLEWSTAHSVPTGELNFENNDLTGVAGSPGVEGGAGDGLPDNWIQFGLAANLGGSVTITGISLSAWRDSTSSPEYYQWDYSLNGGATWIRFGDSVEETSSGLVGGNPVFQQSSFTDSIQGSSVLLRFAPYGGTGSLHIDGITVTGTVVPEPSLPVLLLLPAAGVALFRRRRP